jgi:hypothetical protein
LFGIIENYLRKLEYNLFRRMIMQPDTNHAQGNQNHPGISVQCGVSNCQYNMNGSKCSAKQVRVGPRFANSSLDTVCDTFKPAGTDDAVRNKYQ